MPADTALQLPGHCLAVGAQAAVLPARYLGRQLRHQVAVRVPARQRLIEDAAGLAVLDATSVVRIQVHGSLPIDELQGAAAAALGRLVGQRGLRLRDAFVHQQHRGHRRRQPQAKHLQDEVAAR